MRWATCAKMTTKQTMMAWQVSFVLVITCASLPAMAEKVKFRAPDDADDGGMSLEAIREMLTVNQNTFYHLHARYSHTRGGQRCFDRLGCFDSAAPFNNAFNFLPDSPEKIGTQFRLYTKKNPHVANLLNYSDTTSIGLSNFHPQHSTKFIIHGFASRCGDNWSSSIVAEFLRAGNLNVICVDWSAGAALPNYPQAAANTRVVGAQVAKLVSLLHAVTGNTHYHVIGHSLGAHAAGYAGDRLRGNLRLERISGLDPADPCFAGQNPLDPYSPSLLFDPAVRLDPSDALFVDVIHTNGAPFINGGAGLYPAVGHVDFYPNGGKVQPGCAPLIMGTLDSLIHLDFGNIVKLAKCSHERACKLYVDTINHPQERNCNFLAFPCNNDIDFENGKCLRCPPDGCPELGFHATPGPSSHGSNYLLTHPVEPYCGIPYTSSLFVSAKATNTLGNLYLNVTDGKQEEFLNMTAKDNEEIKAGVAKTKVLLLGKKLHITDVAARYDKYSGMWCWMPMYSCKDEIEIDRVEIHDGSGHINRCYEGGTWRDGHAIQLDQACLSRFTISLSTDDDKRSYGQISVTFTDNIQEYKKIHLTNPDSTIKSGETVSKEVKSKIKALSDIVEVTIKYDKHSSFFYTGLEQLTVNKATISDAHGNRVCYHGGVFQDGAETILVKKSC